MYSHSIWKAILLSTLLYASTSAHDAPVKPSRKALVGLHDDVAMRQERGVNALASAGLGVVVSRRRITNGIQNIQNLQEILQAGKDFFENRPEKAQASPTPATKQVEGKQEKKTSRLSNGAIAGIAVAGALVVVLIITLICICLRRK